MSLVLLGADLACLKCMMCLWHWAHKGWVVRCPLPEHLSLHFKHICKLMREPMDDTRGWGCGVRRLLKLNFKSDLAITVRHLRERPREISRTPDSALRSKESLRYFTEVDTLKWGNSTSLATPLDWICSYNSNSLFLFLAHIHTHKHLACTFPMHSSFISCGYLIFCTQYLLSFASDPINAKCLSVYLPVDRQIAWLFLHSNIQKKSFQCLHVFRGEAHCKQWCK